MRVSMNISFPPFMAGPLRELTRRLKAKGTSLSRELRPILRGLLAREGITVLEPDFNRKEHNESEQK